MEIYLTGAAAASIMLLIYLLVQAAIAAKHHTNDDEEFTKSDFLIILGVTAASWIGVAITLVLTADAVEYYFHHRRKK